MATRIFRLGAFVLFLAFLLGCGESVDPVGPVIKDQPPTIQAIEPVSGSIIAATDSITVVLDKEVDQSTVGSIYANTTGNIQALQPLEIVIIGKKIVIKPAGQFVAGESLTVIFDGVKDLDGLVLTRTVLHYTVRENITPPTYLEVVSTTPTISATDIIPDTISIRFNEEIQSGTLTIYMNGKVEPLPGMQTIAGDSIIFVFEDDAFPSGVGITAKATNFVSTAGHRLEGNSFEFSFTAEEFEKLSTTSGQEIDMVTTTADGRLYAVGKNEHTNRPFIAVFENQYGKLLFYQEDNQTGFARDVVSTDEGIFVMVAYGANGQYTDFVVKYDFDLNVINRYNYGDVSANRLATDGSDVYFTFDYQIVNVEKNIHLSLPMYPSDLNVCPNGNILLSGKDGNKMITMEVDANFGHVWMKDYSYGNFVGTSNVVIVNNQFINHTYFSGNPSLSLKVIIDSNGNELSVDTLSSAYNNIKDLVTDGSSYRMVGSGSELFGSRAYYCPYTNRYYSCSSTNKIWAYETDGSEL